MFGLAQKAKGKEEEELSDSMQKLNVEESSSGLAGTSSTNFKKKPVIIIVVGMAGKFYKFNMLFLIDLFI